MAHSITSAGVAAFVLLGFTLFQSFWSTGIVYGWPSLLSLLNSEDVYRHRCEDYAESCPERTLAFNLVFSIGAMVNVSGGVACGFLVDCIGPRKGILIGLVLIIAGSLCLGLADVDSEWAWPLAYVFYGLGGCCVHLSSFSLGNAFGKAKGVVISCFVAMFSISALAFQVFDLAYRAGLALRSVALVHVGMEALNMCFSGWLWPDEALKPGTRLTWSRCRIKSAGSLEQLDQAKSLTARERCVSALSIARTWKFLGFLTFHFTQLGLNRCLMGWMAPELRWKNEQLLQAGRQGLDLEHELSVFNFLQAAGGFLSIPAFGWIVARFGHRRAPFCATAGLAALFLAVRPFVEPWLLPVLYIVSACHRQLFFSTFFTFLISEYPAEQFATLAGMANIIAGLVSFLQNPLLDMVLRNMNGDFLLPLLAQLGLAVVVFICSLIAWFYDKPSLPPPASLDTETEPGQSSPESAKLSPQHQQADEAAETKLQL
ncbi:SLC43A1 [Symbiodinium natans]|uniref:SLC43A1 protein n=1 Tax=Symbiodinium natans TaxID=878477 RepID=A0A812R7W4_9DINO|nr:SLC43A1 [Symbiodinium natans]